MPYRPKIKDKDGSLTDLPIEAETSVKLKTSRSIGLSGVKATAQSFNGTCAITIPITEVPISLVSGLLDKTYPVGSIYTSISSTSPASLFGGSWERLYDRFLIGAGNNYSAGNTGGETTHRLTLAEMPSHEGHLSNNWENWGGNYNGRYLSTGKANAAFGDTEDDSHRGWNVQANNEIAPAGHTCGEGSSHNNMPPYLAVYMWKRIA